MDKEFLSELADECDLVCKYNDSKWESDYFDIDYEGNIKIDISGCGKSKYTQPNKYENICTECRFAIHRANLKLRDSKIEDLKERLNRLEQIKE